MELYASHGRSHAYYIPRPSDGCVPAYVASTSTVLNRNGSALDFVSMGHTTSYALVNATNARNCGFAWYCRFDIRKDNNKLDVHVRESLPGGNDRRVLLGNELSDNVLSILTLALNSNLLECSNLKMIHAGTALGIHVEQVKAVVKEAQDFLELLKGGGSITSALPEKSVVRRLL